MVPNRRPLITMRLQDSGEGSGRQAGPNRFSPGVRTYLLDTGPGIPRAVDGVQDPRAALLLLPSVPGRFPKQLLRLDELRVPTVSATVDGDRLLHVLPGFVSSVGKYAQAF